MLLDGKELQSTVIDDIKPLVNNKNIKNAIILIGENDDSISYINGKRNLFSKVNISTEFIRYNNNVTEKELLNKIDELNKRTDITGILIQKPLPRHINDDNLINAIDPKKDLDCFHPVNIGNMFVGNMRKGVDILPCTPLGILMLLENNFIFPKGKDIVIVGRSNIVGKPLATMLTNLGATVTSCNSNTKLLKDKTKKADIVILATGHPKMFNNEWFKKHSVVVDVGINKINGKLYGDYDKDQSPYDEFIGYISPVPNGVGRCTTAALLYNTIACYNMQNTDKIILPKND